MKLINEMNREAIIFLITFIFIMSISVFIYGLMIMALIKYIWG
jgi:hypothetical protein